MPPRLRRRWRAPSSATLNRIRLPGAGQAVLRQRTAGAGGWRLERALRLQPDRGEAHEGMAEALLAARRPAEARRHARRRCGGGGTSTPFSRRSPAPEHLNGAREISVDAAPRADAPRLSKLGDRVRHSRRQVAGALQERGC